MKERNKERKIQGKNKRKLKNEIKINKYIQNIYKEN